MSKTNLYCHFLNLKMTKADGGNIIIIMIFNTIAVLVQCFFIIVRKYLVLLIDLNHSNEQCGTCFDQDETLELVFYMPEKFPDWLHSHLGVVSNNNQGDPSIFITS